MGLQGSKTPVKSVTLYNLILANKCVVGYTPKYVTLRLS